MIFGTDGLRATVGQEPLTETTIQKLSKVLREDLGSGAKVVIGRDTRRSGNQIFKWITQQFAGLELLDLGVVPTPTVAYETKHLDADLGIMITASHNPPGDNGLKFFNGSGLKAAYPRAVSWSDGVLAMDQVPLPDPGQPRIQAPNGYRDFIKTHFRPDHFRGLRVAFDFAHGAATGLGEELITGLIPGALFVGDSPTGDNINAQVGALHPEELLALVQSKDLDAGFAFDGDGDRLVVVDRDGIIHGDILLYALKNILRDEGQQVHSIVGTILCGLGFENQLQQEGIHLHRTPVGDQNVLAKMVAEDIPLGGEPSGHLIQSDLFPAGDGLLGALRLARALAKNKDILSQARATIPLFPVFEKAYRVRHKPALIEIPSIQTELKTLQADLEGSGRVILRYSGTESKIRLFVEAPDLKPFEAQVDRLVQAIQETLS